MIVEVYCDRKGCGKVVGAQRIEDGAVLEEEFIEGAVFKEVQKDEDTTETKCFCSQECADKMDQFMTPEEMEDE